MAVHVQHSIITCLIIIEKKEKHILTKRQIYPLWCFESYEGPLDMDKKVVKRATTISNLNSTNRSFHDTK